MASWSELAKLGKNIDNGIKKLTKTWDCPSTIIHGYDKDVGEASQHLENFLVSVKDIHEEVAEDMQPRTNYVNEMDRFLSECQSIYNELKDQCTDIDTLLSEYGYVGANTSNMSHSESEHSSILAPEHMESLLISSPGDYLLKNLDDDDDYQENTSPNNAVIIMNKPTCIKTPVIKSLASVLKTENSEMYGLQSTPLCSLRAEPTYSPYYYSKK